MATDSVEQERGISVSPGSGAPACSTCPVALEATLQPVDTLQLNRRSPSELRQSQLNDAVIGPNLQSQARRNQKCKAKAEFRLLVQQWEQLKVTDGLLYRTYEDETGNVVQLQLVVPKCLGEEILQELHGRVMSGHLGEEKTLGGLKGEILLAWP